MKRFSIHINSFLMLLPSICPPYPARHKLRHRFNAIVTIVPAAMVKTKQNHYMMTKIWSYSTKASALWGLATSMMSFRSTSSPPPRCAPNRCRSCGSPCTRRLSRRRQRPGMSRPRADVVDLITLLVDGDRAPSRAFFSVHGPTFVMHLDYSLHT